MSINFMMKKKHFTLPLIIVSVLFFSIRCVSAQNVSNLTSLLSRITNINNPASLTSSSTPTSGPTPTPSSLTLTNTTSSPTNTTNTTSSPTPSGGSAGSSTATVTPTPISNAADGSINNLNMWKDKLNRMIICFWTICVAFVYVILT
ncbi:3113_t:CDS:2 [Diversispora eburnea]|uniref:3113_t:CDS:1 n=1 Tax=Diversispora eburnea TaxID=1213867 RepID=A0A9N9F6J0_9GLOM|nr:3113_t:CDS:2 [Diversispora eburnea]